MKKQIWKNIPWALSVFYILLLYFLPEKIITGDYTPTQTVLDEWIPFCAPFVIPYLLWFPGLAAEGVRLLFKEGTGFRQYMLYLLLAYSLAALIYVFFPNGQDLRPALDNPQGIFEWMLSLIYAVDTNTNVCPSLHVLGGMAVMFAVCTDKTEKKPMKLCACLFFAAVSVSTVFVKQHAVVDVAAGLFAGTLLYVPVYRFRVLNTETPLS